MSLVSINKAKRWFEQASSDARTAEALMSSPAPMQPADVGCHVAAMCAQAIEKSLKGYVYLNRLPPALDHRPDKYIPRFLTGEFLKYPDHRGGLSRLFDLTTKANVRSLLDFTPGGLGNGNDKPNTEYPWTPAGGATVVPMGAPAFDDQEQQRAWLQTAKRVSETLYKFCISVERGTAL